MGKVFGINLLVTCNPINDLYKATNLLYQHFQPEGCYVISAEHYDRDQFAFPVGEYFASSDIRTGKYEPYIWFDECLPLSEELIRSMAGDEPAVLKMMERHDIFYQQDFEFRKRLYYRHIRYWSYFLDRAEISAFVCYELPHGVLDYIIYLLCRKKKIATAFVVPGPFEGYSYFSHDVEAPCPRLPEIYRDLASAYEQKAAVEITLQEDLLRSYEIYSDPKADKTPYYMRSTHRSGSEKICHIVRRFKRIYSQFRRKGFIYLQKSTRTLVSSISLRIRLQFATRKLFGIYDRLSQPVDLAVPYIYFPLHYQPESTTNPMGGVFVHQMLAVQMLAGALPPGIKIYVKEHPKQTARCRDFRLYKDLDSMDNVVLADRSTDTYALLQGCVAVATVTGTAGLEGLFMDKPFLMFGSYINMYAPGVFNIRSNAQCRGAVESILRHGAKHTLKDLKIYFKALEQVLDYASTTPLVTKVNITVDENAANIANGLIGILKEQLGG